MKIKLLNSTNLNIPNLNTNTWNPFSCCLGGRNMTRDTLIIHVHGGGFVAMSSSSHEGYLRKWTNQLDVPIISIDYRLAPEFPYPCAVDDVWQAYNWILDNATNILNIELQNIILIGDSAGGNLILSLCYLLIVHNKRLPDLVIPAYPALRITDQFYTPSMLLCIQDKILSHTLVRYCLQSYRGGYDSDNDPFLSPILMHENILKLMPKILIVVGSSDPLRDDCVRYLKRFVYLLIFI